MSDGTMSNAVADPIPPGPEVAEKAAAEPGLRVSVTADGESGETFTVSVRRGDEVIETFAGLTMETAAEKVNAESKLIIVNDSVAEKFAQALKNEQLIKAVNARRRDIRAEFGEMISAARPRNVGEEVPKILADFASAKLRVFGGHASSPELGMRLALMNNKQRRKFLAEGRHAKGDAKRKQEARARILAKKGKRR